MQNEIINVDENTKYLNKNIIFNNNISQSKSFIKFKFEDGKDLYIDKNNFLSLNPSILNNNNISIITLNENSFQINLPKYITKEDFSLFLSILLKSDKSLNDDNFFNFNDNDIKGNKIINLLKISDYFNNEEFNIKLINDYILPFNNDNIIIDLLNYSYRKLSNYSEKKKLINNAYFDLFYKSLENISKNEQLVLNNLERIKYLDKKIIDEIIEKIFQNLIYGNTLLIEEKKEISNTNSINNEYDLFSNNVTNNNNNSPNNENRPHILNNSQFKELINFLMEIKNKKDFFDLLTSEYAYLLSKDSINELKNLPHPSLQVDIHFSEYSYYSQEFPLEIILNHKKIILIVSYKKADQSFNVCIKLSHSDNKKKNCNSILEIDKISEEQYIEENSCFKIFTFLTHVIITKGPEKVKIATQNNLLSLSNNKTIYNLLKISNFDNELRNFLIREPDKEYFSVIVQIKLCYIYSALASYLLKEFFEFNKDPKVCKISKQLLIIILENKYLNKKNDKEIVETILLWLQDEININEDISCIFKLIKWENIEDDLIFELIIKYSHIIAGNKSLEKIFIDAFEKKYNNSIIIGNILKSLFYAGQKIEYNKIFSQMKKSEKYNKYYKFFNSESKLKNNLFGECSSLSKDSCSFREGFQNFLNNSFNDKNRNNKEKEKEFENNKNNNNNYLNINSQNNSNDNTMKTIKIRNSNSNKKNIKKIYIKNNKNNSSNNSKSNYKINQQIDTSKKNTSKINNIKKSKEKIILFKNNSKFLKKDLSLFNIKHKKYKSKINLNKKNIKSNDINKLSISCLKSFQNSNSSNNRNNISNVSININNISNINISNNNYTNYKTQNNDYYLKNRPNQNKKQSISLNFCTYKNKKKSKNIIKKNGNNSNNSPIRLFSIGNNNNSIKKNNSKSNNKSDNSFIDFKNNNNLKTQNIPKKYNNLLSTILNYDKIMNKSTYGNRRNKSKISIKKNKGNKSNKNIKK